LKINWVFGEIDTKQKVIEEAIVNESLTLGVLDPAPPFRAIYWAALRFLKG
jgi:hypothetical protein